MGVLPQTVTTKTRTFTDIDLSFQRHPVTGDICFATGDTAVAKSFRNLIQTNFYERPFRPNLGSGVPQKLFELITPLTAQNIKDHITQVAQFEPRISLVSVVVTAMPQDDYFTATITFYIQNNTQPTTVTTMLQRVR